LSLDKVEEVSERNTININWKNDRSVENYENILKDKIRNIKFNNIFVNEEDPKGRIDEYYFSLKNAFIQAHNETTNLLYGTSKRSVQNNWWIKEMSKLKKELKKARLDEKLWHSEESKRSIKTAKRNFRREQRRCMFVYEEKKNINIENLYDKPSKEDFKKALDEFKRNKETLVRMQ
jgi:hypothetical protein